MSPELTVAHWLYLAGVAVVLVTMGMRKNPIVPAVLFTGLVAAVYTGDAIHGMTAIFSSILTAATDLFSIVLIIALITAMLAMLRMLGADTLMVRPFAGVMRNGHVAFFVLALAAYVLSLFLWPTPSVPLIAAVLMPVAIRAGLSPMGVAVAVALAGQGMALSSDYVIRVAPNISAKAAGADAAVVAERSLVLSLVVGTVALVLAYLWERRSIRHPSGLHVAEWQGLPTAAEPEPGTTDAGASDTESGQPADRSALIMAIAVPLAYAALIGFMVASKLSPQIAEVTGDNAAGLVGSLAALLCVVGAVLVSRRRALKLVADGFTSGFTWAMKVMAIVFPIAGFFFLGNPAYSGTIMGLDEAQKAPGFLFDLVSAGQSVLPQGEVVLSVGVLLAGMVGGLDGAGFSVLPLTGSIAGSLGSLDTAEPATLAAIGQMGAIWVGGGTLAAWSSVVAVAGFARVDVVDLTRRCLIPVVTGLAVATGVALLIY